MAMFWFIGRCQMSLIYIHPLLPPWKLLSRIRFDILFPPLSPHHFMAYLCPFEELEVEIYQGQNKKLITIMNKFSSVDGW